MNKLEAFFWMIIGLAFGVSVPLGIEQTIHYLSPTETMEANRAFLFYFLIAIASGVLAGQTVLWLRRDKNDNRISAILGFIAAFMVWCAFGISNTGNKTYVVGLVLALASFTISLIVHSAKILPWSAKRNLSL